MRRTINKSVLTKNEEAGFSSGTLIGGDTYYQVRRLAVVQMSLMLHTECLSHETRCCLDLQNFDKKWFFRNVCSIHVKKLNQSFAASAAVATASCPDGFLVSSARPHTFTLEGPQQPHWLVGWCFNIFLCSKVHSFTEMWTTADTWLDLSSQMTINTLPLLLW